MKKFINLALILTACGTNTTNPTLEGNWYMEDLNHDCVYLLNLKNSEYNYITLCSLNDGQYGTEISSGSYTAQNGQLTFAPEKGSCPSNQYPNITDIINLEYKLVDKNHLALNSKSGLEYYERLNNNDNSGTANFIYGCYEGANFTQNPVAPY